VRWQRQDISQVSERCMAERDSDEGADSIDESVAMRGARRIENQ
jgi:hypothetical protein